MSNKIEEILMHDELYKKHFVAKHPPRYEFSGQINTEFLERDYALDYMINWLVSYIKFPLIEDTFAPSQHQLRREWRKKLIERYGEDIRKILRSDNKLSGNILSGVYSASSIISDYLGEEFPELNEKAKRIVELTDPHIEDYHEKNISERIEVVRKIEEKVYELLKAMSE